MRASDDLYPTRNPSTSTASVIERQDPVTYGQPREISPAAMKSYRDNGYLVERSLLSSMLPELTAASDALLDHPPAEGSVMEPPPDGRLRSVFGPHSDPRIMEAANALRGIAEDILGSPVYLHQSRINYKRGTGATGWGWHSDFETWHSEDGMPRMRALTAMVALTPNLPDNGPLGVIPGSHRYFVSCPGETPDRNYESSLQDQKVGVLGETELRLLQGLTGSGLEWLVLDPGDVVFFDCNTAHGSRQSTSSVPRTNLFLVFNSTENRLVDPFCGLPPRPEYAGSRSSMQ